jgi:glycosyltransferase involved in cell wall biosynthesis
VNFEPHISVIIRAYDAEATIREAIESVINQTYEGPIEIVICYDKGSSDRTYDIVAEYFHTLTKLFTPFPQIS